MNHNVLFDKQGFTDRVMEKIALKTAVRKHRRTVLNTVLYSVSGVAAVAAIIMVLNYTGLLSMNMQAFRFTDITEAVRCDAEMIGVGNSDEVAANLNAIYSFFGDMVDMFKNMAVCIADDLLCGIHFSFSHNIILIAMLSFFILLIAGNLFFDRYDRMTSNRR